MTAVMQKPVQKSGTWASIFPTDQSTEQLSALFVKKLLAVAVSNIAYLRAIFPENAFGDRSLEGLNLKILREDISCPGASQVAKWVRGCFDALDKKYLRAVMLGLYIDPDEPDTVIEAYTFKFSYRDGGGIDIYRNKEKISSAHAEVETRKATICLLRTLILLTQTLDALPDNVMMTMKLLYYDEVTPEDYEPPGFKASGTDNFEFDDEPMTIKIGDIKTPFHSIRGRLKTGKKQFLMKDSQDPQLIDEEKEIENGLDDEAIERMSQDDTQALTEPTVSADIPQESPAKPAENAVDHSGSELSQNTEKGEEFKVRCPCGCNEDDGLMIMCNICKFWQHGVCFLILDEDEAPENHVCDECAEEGNKEREPTDFYLLNLTSIQIQATCLWRRALLASLEVDRIVAPFLAKRLGTEMTVAQGLINRLEREGLVKSGGRSRSQRLGKVVDKEKISNEAIPKYMTRKEKGNSSSEKTNQEKEPVNPMTTEKKADDPVKVVEPMEVPNNDVDKLTEKTGKLKINNKRDKLSRKKTKATEKQDDPVSKTDEHSQNEMTVQEQVNAKRLSRKRAVSKRDMGQEFEISSTQDFYGDEPRKRKKASVVSKDIMV